MSDLDNERFYPAPPEDVYDALGLAARVLRWRVKTSDDFTKSMTLSTPASGFSWGATLGAQVVPAEGGSIVRVGGTQKVRVNFTARSPEYKNTIKLLDQVSRILQESA